MKWGNDNVLMIYASRFDGRFSSHSHIVIKNSTPTFFIFYNYTFTTLIAFAFRLVPYALRFTLPKSTP